MLGNEHEAFGESPNDNRFNCWQSLKPDEPQREDETSLSVTATKVEKIIGMGHGVSLNSKTMGLQQRSPEQGNVQRLSREGVASSEVKRSAPCLCPLGKRSGEDIVCAAWKHAGAMKLMAGGE